MKCNKCSGFALYEPFFEFIGSRCMNCGKRFWDTPTIANTEFERFILQQYNEQRKPKPKPTIVRRCEYCHKKFGTRLKFKRFCNISCVANGSRQRRYERFKKEKDKK